ncbi:hypothetical protein ACEPAI_207 [Sanghuangporus weigelae]
MDSLRWKPGKSFGPVLKPLDIYLLESKLELHPVLAQKCDDFRLEFNLATGQTIGFKGKEERVFTMKDETATLPRITELYIITKSSPWCTIVRNPEGVTLADVCRTLWKDYTDLALTEPEFKDLSPREQDRIQRMALRREAGGFASAFSGMWGASSTVSFSRCKRIDWLYGKTYFDGLERDDDLAKKKLGFAAPNVFKLRLGE